MNCLKTVFYLLVALINIALFLPLPSKIIPLVPMCVFYVLVNSKTTHPHPLPGQTPGHLTFLKNFGQIPTMLLFSQSNASPIRASKRVKSTTLSCHALMK